MIFLTVPQAAERLQCSEGCVRDMINAGKLYAVRIGKTTHGDIRISEAALLELGVGGPRPIILASETVVRASEAVAKGSEAVASGSKTVATPDVAGYAPVRPRMRTAPKGTGK